MRPHIAVNGVADMQRNTEIQWRFVFAAAASVKYVHIGDRQFRCPERAFADFGDVTLILDPENAEDGIADEFQNLAAVGVNRAGHGFEVVVQNGN